jgi:signal transduction histidine kinase
MARRRVKLEVARWWAGLSAGVAMLAAVTGLISLLERHIPPIYLLVLYLLAVLPVAVVWGTGLAVATAVLSVAVYAFLFVSRTSSLAVWDSRIIVALGVFLVTAIVVGELAARLQRAAHASARLSEEQSALRRVATLVAQSAAPLAVFDAVTREIGLLCRADLARMERYETDGTVTGVAAWSSVPAHLVVGTRFELDGLSVARDVRQTGGPVRIESFGGAAGAIAQEAHALGLRSSVGCPIVASGRLWGVIAASATSDKRFPVGTEAQIASFTELVATAIENAEASAELRASRARIVTTADQTRRRIERDLHDGAQQRLVSAALQLRAVQGALSPARAELAADLDRVVVGLTDALEELREIARGIHPAILAEGGLAAALKTLARRSPIPVELVVRVDGQLPERADVSAYYVVSEALTNASKHSQASAVTVSVEAADGALRVTVRDNGVGGADATRGTGLTGLKDRVQAFGGRIYLDSPHNAGTTLEVELPLTDAPPVTQLTHRRIGTSLHSQ